MVKKISGLVLGILLFGWLSTPSVFADYEYDYTTGNSYIYNSYPDGGGYLYGWNLSAGTNWNTNYYSNGNMYGQDSDGDSWQYNSSTGYYWNSDGTTCSGFGYARTCW